MKHLYNGGPYLRTYLLLKYFLHVFTTKNSMLLQLLPRIKEGEEETNQRKFFG